MRAGALTVFVLLWQDALVRPQLPIGRPRRRLGREDAPELPQRLPEDEAHLRVPGAGTERAFAIDAVCTVREATGAFYVHSATIDHVYCAGSNWSFL